MKKLSTLIIAFGLILSSLAGTTNDTAGTGSPMFIRAFVVTDSLMTRLHRLVPAKPGESNQDLLLRYFKTQQIEVRKPGSIQLDEKKKTLTVQATPFELDRIELLVSKLDKNEP